MKILHLTLKGKWFDMIRRGQKLEEYREIKPYWVDRLVSITHIADYDSLIQMLRDGDYRFMKRWDIVRFRHGYAKDAPTVDVRFGGIEVGTGQEEWGAEPGKKYFVIRLGNIIN